MKRNNWGAFFVFLFFVLLLLYIMLNYRVDPKTCQELINRGDLLDAVWFCDYGDFPGDKIKNN
ncbi:MAG: hypothetical protein ABIL76_08500 [candidate division WOR-3 bacterium]